MKNVTLCLAVLAISAAAGCAHEVQFVGYDRSDQILLELRKGLQEYHGDEAIRRKAVRNQVVAAFTSDVVAAAGEKEKVTAATTQFLGLLDQMDANRRIEAQRYAALNNNITAAIGLNAKQRALTEVRLGVGDDLSRHWVTLREMALQRTD